MDLFFFVLPLVLVAAGYVVPGWSGASGDGESGRHEETCGQC